MPLSSRLPPRATCAASDVSQLRVDSQAVREDNQPVAGQVGIRVHDVELDARLEEDLGRSLHVGVLRRGRLTAERLGPRIRHDRHLGGRSGAAKPRLQLLHALEDPAYEPVDRRIEHSRGMELVADEDTATRGHDRARLVLELVGGLDAAEIRPRLVEAAGHAQEWKPVGAGLPGGDRVVEVAPQARRRGQALDVEVSLKTDGLGPSPHRSCR